MSIVQINQIQTRIGTVIPSIGGTIVSVFPSKSGKGQHGNWKLQNIKIQDNSGDCQVTLSSIDQDLNDSHKGKNIEFESVGTKFGLKGVSVEKRDYVDKNGNNVSTTGVKVTKTAKIRLEGAGMVQEDAKDDIPFDEPKTLVNKNGDPYINKREDNISLNISTKSPQERIDQFVDLYDVCFLKVKLSGFSKDPLTTPDMVKDVSTTIFIAAQREGLADKMEVDGKEPF